MRSINFPGKILLILLLFTVCSCSKDMSKDKKDSISGKDFIETSEGFYGWDSIILRNSYTRLDVVPELGGKIMGYNPMGLQILWHNPAHEGEVEIFLRNDFGETFINAGGAKVWPAPQDKWGGPPDRILDGSPYTYSFDGKTITVTSPEDDGINRTGLQYNHRYSLIPSSTIVNINLSMTNVVDHSIEWALWHLATVPVDRNFTVYVPVNKGNWNVMHGEEDSNQWLGVDNGLFRARYNKLIGKVGMKVREGWAAWHDEENNIVYALFFPVEEDAEYPHSGHNFEIWSTGETINPDGNLAAEMSYMELEVLGPLTKLAPGESATLDVKWGVCRCSGIKRVLPFGVIVEEFKIDDEGFVTGKFGTFQYGTFEQFLVDKDGNKMGRERLMEASPLSEVSLNIKPYLPEDVVAIRYQIRDSDDNIIGILGEVKVK
ncbi:DUF4380 domain-containing protein [Candidatus Latescibacterota bacterium]